MRLPQDHWLVRHPFGDLSLVVGVAEAIPIPMVEVGGFSIAARNREARCFRNGNILASTKGAGLHAKAASPRQKA